MEKVLLLLLQINETLDTILKIFVILLCWLSVGLLIHNKVKRYWDDLFFPIQEWEVPVFVKVYHPLRQRKEIGIRTISPEEWARGMDVLEKRVQTKIEDDKRRKMEIWKELEEMGRTMSYQLYRNTTLGHTLQESLDELIQYNQITPALANKILLQFDRSMNNSLATRVKSRLTFKAGKLHTYRFCDNVWTFLLNDVEFREVHEVARVDKVKIVACDGKTVATHPPPIAERDD